MTTKANATPEQHAKRLSMSQILEMVLSRGGGDRSAVTIGRSPSGIPYFEVVARTGEGESVEDAEQRARAVYERLGADYAVPQAHDNADLTLTRNAKGETQVAISAKTSPVGIAKLDELLEVLQQAYDSARMSYPMADGYTARPGSVKAGD